MKCPMDKNAHCQAHLWHRERLESEHHSSREYCVGFFMTMEIRQITRNREQFMDLLLPGKAACVVTDEGGGKHHNRFRRAEKGIWDGAVAVCFAAVPGKENGRAGGNRGQSAYHSHLRAVWVSHLPSPVQFFLQNAMTTRFSRREDNYRHGLFEKGAVVQKALKHLCKAGLACKKTQRNRGCAGFLSEMSRDEKHFKCRLVNGGVKPLFPLCKGELEADDGR